MHMLARQRAHLHRVREEDRGELLADGHHLVARAQGDLAEEGDAAEDGLDLVDLLVELAHERVVEIRLVLHEPQRDLGMPFANARDDRVDFRGLLRARGFARGDEVVRHAGQRGDDDDRLPVPPLRDDVDRVRDLVGVAYGRASELDDDHGASNPRASSNSALRIAAPAAPRIVLCTSATRR
jgi:hypothetical protein